MLIETLSVPFVLVSPTNITTSSVTEPVPQIAVPVNSTNGGVIAMGGTADGQFCASAVKLVFFGVGSDSNTFTAYVYGWEVQRATLQGNLNLHIPVLLVTLTTITLDSAQPGVTGTDVPATNFFATAITLGVGNQGTDVDVVSPGHASHEIAHATVDSKGCRFLEIRFATGGSATSCNALVRKM